jgi:hypothetical protein
MPAKQASLALTDRYRARLLRLRIVTTVTAGELWALIDWADLDGSFRRFLAAASPTVTVAQADAARMSIDYLGDYIASETGGRPTTPGIDPHDYSGTVRDGRTIAAAVKLAIAQRRTQPQSLAAGAAVVTRVAGTEVVDSGRRALTDAMQVDNRIVGWRRVTSNRPCGACLAAATGAIHKDDEVPHVHSHCRCTAEPVVRGVADRVHRQTGPALFDAMSKHEQDRLFVGRGGEQKAELLRTGAVAMKDLITVERQARWGTGITETPLAALLAKAAQRS